MKHRLLTKWSMLLSSLSLLLAGCSTTQKGVQRATSEHQIMALYGVPVERYEPIPTETDSTATPVKEEPKAENDTTTKERPQIMVKYGVPFPRG